MATKTGKSGSWNWNDANAWVEGAWVDGDVATIPTGGIYTIPAGVTVVAGASGATGTIAITVNGNGSLTCQSGGHLILKGDLVHQKGTTVEFLGGSSLTFQAPTGSQYKWQPLATGTGTANMKITGTGWGVGQFVTITSSTVDGGNYGYIDSNVSSFTIMNFAYAHMSNLGVSGGNGLYFYSDSSGRDVTLSNIIYKNSSTLKITSGAAVKSNVSYLDIRDSIATNYVLQLTNNAALSTGQRNYSSITIYNPTNYLTWQIASPNVSLTKFVCYKTVIEFSGASVVDGVYSDFILADCDNGSNSSFLVPKNGNVSISSGVFLQRRSNTHAIGVTTNNGNKTKNLVNGVLFDFDGYTNVDLNDAIVGLGGLLISNCLCINHGGSLYTATTADCVGELYNNTLHGDGVSLAQLGWPAGAATQLAAAKNNLIARNGGNVLFQLSNMVSQSSMVLDYNCSFELSYAGGTVYPSGHPFVGQRSYLGPPSYAPWWSPGKTFGTDIALNDIVSDPKFKDSTWTVRGYFGAPDIITVAREAITINGIGYDGSPVTATTKTPAAVLAAARDAFTPTNKALKGAGEGGVDIGAVPVVVKQSSGRLFSGSLGFRL